MSTLPSSLASPQIKVLFSNIETLLERSFAVTRSLSPSLSKSVEKTVLGQPHFFFQNVRVRKNATAPDSVSPKVGIHIPLNRRNLYLKVKSGNGAIEKL